MTTPTKTFFDDLAQRGHVPWLEAEHGRLRLELVDEDCLQLWTVTFDNGDVRVDRDGDSSLRNELVDLKQRFRKLGPIFLVPPGIGELRNATDHAQALVGDLVTDVEDASVARL